MNVERLKKKKERLERKIRENARPEGAYGPPQRVVTRSLKIKFYQNGIDKINKKLEGA